MGLFTQFPSSVFCCRYEFVNIAYEALEIIHKGAHLRGPSLFCGQDVVAQFPHLTGKWPFELLPPGLLGSFGGFRCLRLLILLLKLLCLLWFFLCHCHRLISSVKLVLALKGGAKKTVGVKTISWPPLQVLCTPRPVRKLLGRCCRRCS